MNDTTDNEDRQRLLQRRARLLAELQNVDQQLEECSTDDQGTDVVGTSDTSNNPILVTTTLATRVICTNKRVENEKRFNHGRWFGGIRTLNPMRWFTFQTAYSVQAQSADAAPTHADQTIPSQLGHDDRPPLQLDTPSPFESSEPECNALRNGSQDSGLSATSQPDVESASCPDAVATSTDETLPFNRDRHDSPSQQLDNGPSFGSSKPTFDAFRGASQDNSLPSTSQPSGASTSCSNIAAAEEHTAADNAQLPKRRRNLKRTYAQMSEECARPFASSLESLSSCDMKTIHAMADPHIRVELTKSGQYCGVTKDSGKRGATKKRKLDGGRDYFDDYCKSVFEDWDACKELAASLIDAGDDELLTNIEAYRQGSREDELYDPFEKLANRVFQFARRALIGASKLRSRCSRASTAKDLPLNLVAVPTYSRPIHGCADKRKPDFVAMHVAPSHETPDPVDARDANCMIELKFDLVVQGQPPKLHHRTSGTAVRSTFGGAVMSHDARLTPHEQMLEYDCVALAAQTAFRRFVLGLLITYMRLQIMYADRAGCMISVERNFSDDFGVLFAVLIGIYRSEARRAGLEPAIRVLSGPDVPLVASDFETLDQPVETGSMKYISRKVAPFEVRVRLASAPTQLVSALGHGFNMMERPMAITSEAAQASHQDSTPHQPLRSRPSTSRLAKSKALEVNQEIALLDAEGDSVDARRQFAPRYIFGSGTARYLCVYGTDKPGAVKSTLQLSWQPKGRLSEVTVLRLANECNVPGVPTLVASNDIAELDDGSVRTRLQRTFAELPSIWPVNKVLRALVWKEEGVPLSTVVDMNNFLSAFQCILRAVVQLNAIGIMHTNVSEANMMALRTDKSQGFLVGFEFAIVGSELRESKMVCSESLRDSDGATQKCREITPAIPGQVFDESVTHHVPSLPLSRCTDYPPVHQFQHELESFVWSFFFILSGFRCGRRIVNAELEKWYTGNWKSIVNAKKGFIEPDNDHSESAGQFAQSLGADPEPLMACTQLLARMLAHSKNLDADRLLFALQEARDAYATME